MALSCENEEFTRFRLEHLRKLKPKVGEQEELERRQEMLSGAEDIRQSLREACDALEGSEGGALAEIREAREALRDLNFGLFETHDSEADLLHRLEMVQIELRDISETLSDYYSRVDSNPELLSRIESRLNQLYDAQRRFKVHDDSELVALKEQLESQLSQIESGDDSLAELEGEVKECGHKLKGLAAELTESRRKASAVVSERLIGMARELGMHNLKFAVTLEKVKLTADGGDSAEFMCAFNKNQTPVAAQKVASGGEISRLMLCIKAIVAHKMQLPTIIFDEVDTGVSGDIADRMGRLMQEISQSIQVIAITHLPQVAVKGATHFRVYKEDLANTTVTNIVKLRPREREEEIARMLSGAVIDQAAILNARALLGGTAGSGTEPGE
jgi:DNA repair protein RecN (Recombination protein N)